MNSSPNPPRRPSPAWPIAIASIAVVAMLAVTGLLMMRELAKVPQSAARQAKEAVSAVLDLAAAFHDGSAETRFRSYITSISGTTYLQVATVDRVETFTREDRASIFWGALPLPDVVVSISVPVRYTAYVDLDGSWDLRLQGDTLRVVAPRLRFNRPSIDASGIELQVENGSLFRDEDAALEALQRELTGRTFFEARKLVPVVRPTARERIREFVSTWLLQSFAGAEGVRIEVVFADEERSPLAAPTRPDGVGARGSQSPSGRDP